MRGIGVVSTLILVRILSPQDFGIVALAQAAYPILDLLTATGFNLALIRMKDPRKEHYDTVWTLSLIRGALIALAIVATSGWQATFMHDERIQPLMWMIAGNAFLISFRNVRLIEFNRDMRFQWVTAWQVWGKVQVFAITMFLAIWLRNYWILILGNLISNFISVPASYFVVPYRPRFTLSGWRELFGFSKWLFLGNICLLTDSQLMNFVVGHYLGMAQVGLFNVGKQIAALPVTEIAAPSRGPMYSAFSKVHSEIDRLRRTFLDGMAMQSLIVIPATAGLAVTAPEVTALFLGNKWLAAIPLLPLIGTYQLFDAAGHYIHTAMLAMNRQKLYTITYYASIALRVPLTIWWALEDGLRGAVLAMLITAAVNAVIWNVQVNRLLNVSFRDSFTPFWRPAIASAAMFLAVKALAETAVLQALPIAVRFLLEAASGALLYAALVTALWLVSGAPKTAPEHNILTTARGLVARARIMVSA